MKEKIKRLEKELAELKAQVNEPELDTGKWYNINGMIVFVEEFLGWGHDGGEGVIGFGFNKPGTWRPPGTEFGASKLHTKEATSDEIESALRKEWERRCKEAGWDDPEQADFTTTLGKEIIQGETPFDKDGLQYNAGLDALFLNGGSIYYKGKWATLLPKTAKIEVNGYEAEFCDGYVKFGCAEIDNRFFKHIAEGNHTGWYEIGKGNRKVEAIKIGEGLFDLETIKEISKHLKN